MQDLTGEYRTELATAVKNVYRSILEAIERFDHAVVDAEAKFTAASNVRLRQFSGDVEPVQATAPVITHHLPGTPEHEAAEAGRRALAGDGATEGNREE